MSPANPQRRKKAWAPSRVALLNNMSLVQWRATANCSMWASNRLPDPTSTLRLGHNDILDDSERLIAIHDIGTDRESSAVAQMAP